MPVSTLDSQYASHFGSLPADLAADLFSELETTPLGISWSESQRRLEEHGPNVAVPHKLPAWYRVLWTSFSNPFNYVLLVLGVVSYLTDDLRGMVVMAVMITAATVLRFWQDYRSLIKAESLRRLVRNKATVLRTENETAEERTPDQLDPNASELVIEELVPGDIVKLTAGDMIPADVRLLESRDLFISQSVLTGEAMPVEKMASPPAEAVQAQRHSDFDAPDFCFMGSTVVSGTATALVTATGPRTQMGQLGSKLIERRPQTAFDRGVNKVTWLLIRFMLVMVPIVFLINGITKHNWVEAFFFGVAVAVGLTPEMLPMVVNANLARGAMGMAREKTVVKHINSIQNFGAMDILCTDKTGTLTRDHVVLIKHLDANGETSERVLEHAYLNSFFQTGLKNLLDRAVIDHGQQDPIVRGIARFFNRIDEIPFDFTRRRMSVVLEPTAAGPSMLFCKGAVDEILEICSSVESNGQVVPLTPELGDQLHQLRDENNDDGLRLVAVAYKAVNKPAGHFSIADEDDLIFSGFIAFLDPPKETAAEALSLLREHGVAVKILTGDNALVARKICQDVGLHVERILGGRELDQLDNEKLREEVEHTTIFARLSPEQKARVVRAFKANRHTVGFMGDGINDALALREADVGISVEAVSILPRKPPTSSSSRKAFSFWTAASPKAGGRSAISLSTSK